MRDEEQEKWVGRKRGGKSGELVETKTGGNFDPEAELGNVQ